MPTLTSCLKKAGKAVSQADAAEMRQLQSDFKADGLDGAQASIEAVETMLTMARQERASLVDEIRSQGGRPPRARFADGAPPAQTVSKAFKKWFGKSEITNEDGSPMVMYHGTKKDFSEFKARFADGLIFFTKDPDFASNWAEGREPTEAAKAEGAALRDKANERMEAEMQRLMKGGMSEGDALMAAYEKVKAKEGEDAAPFRSYLDLQDKTDVRVMPVYLSVQKLFRPEVHYKQIEKTLNAMGADYASLVKDGKHKEGNWIIYENPQVIEALSEMGFDGIQLRESAIGGPSDTIAIWDATKVKSATGNIGTFDPQNADIRFSEGGGGTSFGQDGTIGQIQGGQIDGNSQGAKAAQSRQRATARRIGTSNYEEIRYDTRRGEQDVAAFVGPNLTGPSKKATAR